MVNPVLEKEIHDQLEQLPIGQQRQVLDFARSLTQAKPRGVLGRDLLRFGGTIDPEELQLISQAIHDGCERIDDGW